MRVNVEARYRDPRASPDAHSVFQCSFTNLSASLTVSNNQHPRTVPGCRTSSERNSQRQRAIYFCIIIRIIGGTIAIRKKVRLDLFAGLILVDDGRLRCVEFSRIFRFTISREIYANHEVILTREKTSDRVSTRNYPRSTIHYPSPLSAAILRSLIADSRQTINNNAKEIRVNSACRCFYR